MATEESPAKEWLKLTTLGRVPSPWKAVQRNYRNTTRCLISTLFKHGLLVARGDGACFAR